MAGFDAAEEGELVSLDTGHLRAIERLLQDVRASSTMILVGDNIGEVYLMPDDRAGGRRIWTLEDMAPQNCLPTAERMSFHQQDAS